ncbi:MAG: hypothetical protein JWM31_902 [Solirubrobacterales bacterium]|nr:hypothetical protein [Solirubrobacterales bacterium]
MDDRLDAAAARPRQQVGAGQPVARDAQKGRHLLPVAVLHRLALHAANLRGQRTLARWRVVARCFLSP